MRKLIWAISAAALTALAACDSSSPSQAPAQSADATPAAAPAPPTTPTPEPRPTTEPIPGKGGAYGMPAAPVPYSQLTAYEQQTTADAPPARPAAAPDKGEHKSSDNVFY
jgi:hypothetical protein